MSLIEKEIDYDEINEAFGEGDISGKLEHPYRFRKTEFYLLFKTDLF